MGDTKIRNILICGATGFIGRNLLEYFHVNKSYKIRAVHFNRPALTQYKDVEWIKADLRNADSVKSLLTGIDIVLQFAATTSGSKDILTKPFIHVTDNAVMNSLILRECYEQNIKHFIFPSCTVMYQPSEIALDESSFDANIPLVPSYFGVGNTKLYIEKMCDFFSRLKRTKHTVIRHSNIYGPYDKYDLERSHMFGASVTKVMEAEDKGEITVWGTGEEKRDLLHVNDLLSFVELAINNQTANYELYTVGIGKGEKVIDVIKKIIKYSGKTISIKHDLTMPTIPTSLFLNCNKAKKDLGWEARIDLDSGIIKTIEWYNQNIKQ
jgi:nucleoside-diphosphate-sugar epimerase